MAVLVVSAPLGAGSALLGASAGGVDPAQPDSPPGVGAVLTGLVLAVLTGLAVWLARRGGLLRLAPVAGDARRHEWPILLVAGLLVLLAQPVGGAVLGALFLVPADQQGALRGVAQAAIGGYLGAGIAIAAVGLLAARPVSHIGLRPRGADFVRGLIGILLAAPAVLLVGLVALAAAAWAASFRGAPAPDPNAHATLRLLMAEDGRWSVWWWAVIAAVVIGAPIVEEFVYRGCLQTAMRWATGSRWGAIAGTSGLFTLMHAPVAEPHALAVLLALSVAFGLAYEKTGRLWVPITMHALFNAGNIGGALMMGHGGG